MKSFLVGLLVLGMMMVMTVLITITLPLLMVLGWFLRWFLGFALVLLMIWGVGKITLLILGALSDKKKQADNDGRA